MILRYKIHAYLYTLVHQASQTGTPIFRPLFFDYPNDQFSTDNVENEIMIGSSIKLSPVYSDDKSITVYLPGDQNENWCFLDPTPKFNCFKGG